MFLYRIVTIVLLSGLLLCANTAWVLASSPDTGLPPQDPEALLLLGNTSTQQTLPLQTPSLTPSWNFTQETMPPWRALDSGLELGIFAGKSSAGQPLQLVILRIDPKQYLFSVHTMSTQGQALPLHGWASQNNLIAVTNASMYLPDGCTSTGYLRVGEILNNPRIVSRFGAFFVAEPDSPELPNANLLDRTTDDWNALLPRYKSVVQNYRLISAERHLLWNAGGPRHSIAAIGRDGTGCILFIHCRTPITGEDFGKLLLALPIDVRLVMYAEGGTQAGLLVDTPAFSHTWMGRHPADLWTSGNTEAPLPNVIGIRRMPPRTAPLPVQQEDAPRTLSEPQGQVPPQEHIRAPLAPVLPQQTGQQDAAEPLKPVQESKQAEQTGSVEQPAPLEQALPQQAPPPATPADSADDAAAPKQQSLPQDASPASPAVSPEPQRPTAATPALDQTGLPQQAIQKDQNVSAPPVSNSHPQSQPTRS